MLFVAQILDFFEYGSVTPLRLEEYRLNKPGIAYGTVGIDAKETKEGKKSLGLYGNTSLSPHSKITAHPVNVVFNISMNQNNNY